MMYLVTCTYVEARRYFMATNAFRIASIVEAKSSSSTTMVLPTTSTDPALQPGILSLVRGLLDSANLVLRGQELRSSVLLYSLRTLTQFIREGPTNIPFGSSSSPNPLIDHCRRACAILSLFPEINGGLSAVAALLVHVDHTVKQAALELLLAIAAVDKTALALRAVKRSTESGENIAAGVSIVSPTGIGLECILSLPPASLRTLARYITRELVISTT